MKMIKYNLKMKMKIPLSNGQQNIRKNAINLKSKVRKVASQGRHVFIELLHQVIINGRLI